MNKQAEVVALVEGPTERIFVEKLLAPWLGQKNIFLTPIILSKPGEKGGDVKFARAQRDIGLHLKQRRDTYLTLFIDYYGIKNDWPGYAEAKKQRDHRQKAEIMNTATREKVTALFADQKAARRFIPYVAMFEFEALLFSSPAILARHLGVREKEVQSILDECGEPEKINDSPASAPSKRLEALANRFGKTTTGIAVATEIGIANIRAQCPLFNAWLGALEQLGS